MISSNYPFELKLYNAASQAYIKLLSSLNACFIGFWLGVLKADSLHLLDQIYYDRQSMYREDDYNRRGLWDWEKKMLEQYFQNGQHLLVTSAGGGREVLALKQLGYEVDGFECNQNFVQFANDLLQQEGFPALVQWVDRDQCVAPSTVYDGVIVGWGAYMLVQGRSRRIAFLKELRSRLQPQSPVLLSFYYRTGTSRHYKLIAAFGNLFRTLLRRERLEPGDTMAPNFVHYFTQAEIASELQAAGFELQFYSTEDYGHAVATAIE